MSGGTFWDLAVRRLIDQVDAAGAGDEVPEELRRRYAPEATHVWGYNVLVGAKLWAEQHPDDPAPDTCCWGAALSGPRGCTCWETVFDVDQQPPRPPQSPAELKPRDGMCGDCAFRPGSPERAEQWTADALMDLARSGEPFWCHQGMRRPVGWLHPSGLSVAGCPDDWRPPTRNGVPYQIDGSVGLLCAGWAAVAASAATEGER